MNKNNDTKQQADFLQKPMNFLGIMVSITSGLALLYWFTKQQLLLEVVLIFVLIVLVLYIYLAVHIMYKYYWYFNGGKITEERNLDISFVTKSSLVTGLMVIFAFAGIFSLFSISQTGNLLLTYLPEDYASMIFGFIPSLVLGICIFCILFIFLFFYVQGADQKKTHVLRMEINCNRMFIFAFIIHFILSIVFYVNYVVPILKNSDISVTTNNLFILSLAAWEIGVIVKLALTNLENGQILETENKSSTSS